MERLLSDISIHTTMGMVMDGVHDIVRIIQVGIDGSIMVL